MYFFNILSLQELLKLKLKFFIEKKLHKIMAPVDVCASNCDVIGVINGSNLSHMAAEKIKKHHYKEKCLFISNRDT